MRRSLVACLAIVSCVGSVSDLPDAGTTPPVDGGQTPFDAGTLDAGAAPDSGNPRVDAGAPDSGTPADAGTRDAGVAGDGGCPWAFCDDFESYATGQPPGHPWTANQNGGAVSVVTSKAHGGSHAVYVTNAGAAAYEQAYFSLTAPFFPKSEFYGRVWLYLTQTPSQTTHWTNIQGEGLVADAGNNVRASVRYGGQYSPTIMANYDTSNAATDCWQHSMTAMPTGHWACYEWHYKQEGNLMELWVENNPITSVTINGMGSGCINHDLGDKWILPLFDTLRLGWEHYQTSDPIDLWMDDVALDTQRIGCQ